MQFAFELHTTASTVAIGARCAVHDVPVVVGVAIWPSPTATHVEIEGQETPLIWVIDERPASWPQPVTMVQEPLRAMP